MFVFLLGTPLSPYSPLPLLAALLLTVVSWTVASGPLTPHDDVDLPIRNWGDDKLNRRHVVQSLVEDVASSRAAVVALVGPFGDGKSSVLNLLEERLGNNPNVLVARFNPWLYTNGDALVSALFNTIARTISQNFVMPTLQSKFRHYAQAIAGLVPRIGSSAKEVFREPSQAEQYGRLRQTVEKLRVRLVVLVDDVDRMHHEELSVLLRMIRGATEFSNLTYVCALNKNALAKILVRDRWNMTDAADFLEKFFPVQVALPKIPADILGQHFELLFKRLCDKHKLITDKEEDKDFEDRMQPLWRQHLVEPIAQPSARRS